jgi:hypothetical protein
VLTISRLSRWSINYYNDTANQAQAAAMDRQAAGGGLGGVLLRKRYPGAHLGCGRGCRGGGGADRAKCWRGTWWVC